MLVLTYLTLLIKYIVYPTVSFVNMISRLEHLLYFYPHKLKKFSEIAISKKKDPMVLNFKEYSPSIGGLPLFY